MMKTRAFRFLPLLGLALTAYAAPGHAQYSPSASVNLSSGYAGMASRLGATQLGREMMQKESGDKGASAARSGPERAHENEASDNALAAWRQKRMRMHAQTLAPEYNRRVAHDGESQANAWLASEAQRLGEQDAALWRASHPQD